MSAGNTVTAVGTSTRVAVQLGLKATPVVLFRPVPGELAHVAQRRPLGPVRAGAGEGDRLGFRQAGPTQSFAQVIEGRRGHAEGELANVFGHGCMFTYRHRRRSPRMPAMAPAMENE
jgi:hypothetical protein